MTKAKMIQDMAEYHQLSKRLCGEIFDDLIMQIGKCIIRDGRCAVSGLGVFKKTFKPMRTIRNKMTKDTPVWVPQHNSVLFRPCPSLKARVNR